MLFLILVHILVVRKISLNTSFEWHFVVNRLSESRKWGYFNIEDRGATAFTPQCNRLRTALLFFLRRVATAITTRRNAPSDASRKM